jgi:hypothetical protein
MSEIIYSVDINKNSSITLRDIIRLDEIKSVDVDQTSGKYVVSSPKNESGDIDGEVTIYPQSPQLGIDVPIVLKDFEQVSSLYGPYDSRFDYIRRKLWIADTGNNRVLKINIDTRMVETIITDIIYPHALAVNINKGGVFVKAYSSFDTTGVVYSFSPSGTQLAKFEYLLGATFSSSSSSSSETISSSTSIDVIPTLPFASSIVYDHVRSRVWWVAETKIYMCDTRNMQVNVYDISASNIENLRSIDVELSSGNVLVVGNFITSTVDWTIAQISRDNNKFLGNAYIAI